MHPTIRSFEFQRHVAVVSEQLSGSSEIRQHHKHIPSITTEPLTYLSIYPSTYIQAYIGSTIPS